LRARLAAAAAAEEPASPGWPEARLACLAPGAQGAAVGAAAGAAESGAAAGVPEAADQAQAGPAAGPATTGHFAAPPCPCPCRCRCLPHRSRPRPRSHSRPTSVAAHHRMYITDCASGLLCTYPTLQHSSGSGGGTQNGVGSGTLNRACLTPRDTCSCGMTHGLNTAPGEAGDFAWLAWRRPGLTRCSNRCIKRCRI
jgi:hypothetical protein